MSASKAKIDLLDIRIAIAVAICLLAARFIPHLQALSACTAVILCMQEDAKISWKTGVTRLIITLIGGIAAIIVILLDGMIQNEWVFYLMAALGILFVIWGCKLANVPYISTRIGCVTFVLVILVASGADRIFYALYRLAGTFFGVVVAVVITALFSLLPCAKPEISDKL